MDDNIKLAIKLDNLDLFKLLYTPYIDIVRYINKSLVFELCHSLMNDSVKFYCNNKFLIETLIPNGHTTKEILIMLNIIKHNELDNKIIEDIRTINYINQIKSFDKIIASCFEYNATTIFKELYFDLQIIHQLYNISITNYLSIIDISDHENISNIQYFCKHLQENRCNLLSYELYIPLVTDLDIMSLKKIVGIILYKLNNRLNYDWYEKTMNKNSHKNNLQVLHDILQLLLEYKSCTMFNDIIEKYENETRKIIDDKKIYDPFSNEDFY